MRDSYMSINIGNTFLHSYETRNVHMFWLTYLEYGVNGMHNGLPRCQHRIHNDNVSTRHIRRRNIVQLDNDFLSTLLSIGACKSTISLVKVVEKSLKKG